MSIVFRKWFVRLAGYGWKWLELTDMAGNNMKWLEMNGIADIWQSNISLVKYILPIMYFCCPQPGFPLPCSYCIHISRPSPCEVFFSQENFFLMFFFFNLSNCDFPPKIYWAILTFFRNCISDSIFWPQLMVPPLHHYCTSDSRTLPGIQGKLS